MANRNTQHIIGKQTQNLGYSQGSLGTVRNAYQQNKGNNVGQGMGHGFTSFTPQKRPNAYQKDAMRTHSFGSVIKYTAKPNMSGVNGWGKNPYGSGFAPYVNRANGGKAIHSAWQPGGTQHKDYRAISYRPGGQPLRQWTMDPAKYGSKVIGNVDHRGWSDANRFGTVAPPQGGTKPSVITTPNPNDQVVIENGKDTSITVDKPDSFLPSDTGADATKPAVDAMGQLINGLESIATGGVQVQQSTGRKPAPSKPNIVGYKMVNGKYMPLMRTANGGTAIYRG